jgi:hypothetical protein
MTATTTCRLSWRTCPPPLPRPARCGTHHGRGPQDVSVACARTPGHQLTIVRPHPLPLQRDAARRRAKARLRAVRGRRQRRRKASAGGGAACCGHAHQGRRTRSGCTVQRAAGRHPRLRPGSRAVYGAAEKWQGAQDQAREHRACGRQHQGRLPFAGAQTRRAICLPGTRR